MCLRRAGKLVTALLIAVLSLCAARGQYRPEVPILQVAQEGGPVPGIPNATFSYMSPPQIDAQGNVLFRALMEGPGITYDNDSILCFGPPAGIQILARELDPGPDLPTGVYFESVNVSAAVSETGWIAFAAYLGGPGIVYDVNDTAIFCGPPGDLRLVIQTGSSVPEIGADVTISGTDFIGAGLSDNGTLFVGAGIVGSGLPDNARAYWVGPPDQLQVALWEGMPAPSCPECPPGTYLLWADTIGYNDAGQVAFRGGLSIARSGRWIGLPGALEMMYYNWQPVPLFGPGVVVQSALGTGATLNSYGDRVNRLRLSGSGITADNDWVLVEGAPQPTTVIAREGDLKPEAGEDVYLAFVSTPYLNNLHQVLYRVNFDGPSVGSLNRYGVYFGPYTSPKLVLRDGNSADYFGPGITYYGVSTAGDGPVMNDIGDFMGMTRIRDATGQLTHVWWLWRGLTARYVPLLVDGSEVCGRTVTIADFYGQYFTRTGGSDGNFQSFNDRRQLATLIDFTDGTRGVYRIGPPLLGDVDGDGDVTAAELAHWASCAAGPDAAPAGGYEPLDLDLDTDVDLHDLRSLQAMAGEAR